MLSTTTALPTETSWGDTLKSYQAERGLASWDKLGEAHPPKDHRVTHYEKRSKFNPLLQRHYDPRRERSARNSAAEADGAKLAAALDKQPPFDIVTHEFRKWQDARGAGAEQQAAGLAHVLEHHQPQGQGPQGAPAEVRRRRARAESGLLPASWKRREFDIVSNKYISDHKGRTLRDRTEAKHSAQKLFWETHDFDPLLGRYYDAGKEADFAKQRAVLSSIAGQGSVARLPPAVQYCEGAAYDIVSHAVKDQAKLEVASGVGNRAIASKKGPSVEAELRDRSVKRDDRDKSRALARFAKTVDFCEREGGRHHGYDVLTHESHVGRLARPMATMRIKKPDGPWQQLSKSAAVVTADLGGRPLPATKRSATAKAAPRDLSGAQVPAPPTAPASSRTGNVPMRSKPSGRGVPAPTGAAAPAPRPSVPALKLPTSPA
ncbi:hypothetical protein JL720_7245 [Aureococcus anophagefferens]|nr:hypothetical protein JL720_7245 [Aureococcus anophagefferens]